MSYNIIAGVRNDKKDRKGFVPIYIFIYEGSKLIAKKSIGQKVKPEFWDNEKREVNKKVVNATLINSVISKEKITIETKILQEIIIKDKPDFSAMLHREKVKDISFFDFAESQIEQKNYAKETRRSYRLYTEKIKAFKSSLKLTDIDYKFLQSYEAYLRNDLKNDVNTVWGNFKFINTMIKDAIKCKYLTVDPFTIYKRPKYKQKQREFLTVKELETIEKFIEKNKDKYLDKAAKHFLFMAYTGLRFSDAIRFNASHIINNERIVIETQKTKQIANIYLNDKIKPLAAFIIENPLTLSSVDFNRKLKLIAAYCGITKKVSSHVARHSFGASLVALGVPEKVAQGLLAHGSPASTKIYYHLDNPLLDEAMKKFNK